MSIDNSFKITYPQKTNDPTDAASISKFFALEANEIKEKFNRLVTELIGLFGNTNATPMVGVYTSLSQLSAAFPTGAGGAYAIIDPGTGSDPQIAIYDTNDNQWVIAGASELIIYSANQAALPPTGTEKRLYLTLDNYSIFVWHDSDWHQVGGGSVNLYSQESGNTIQLNGAQSKGYGQDTPLTGPLVISAAAATPGHEAYVNHKAPNLGPIDSQGLKLLTYSGEYVPNVLNQIWFRCLNDAKDIGVKYTQPDDGELSEFYLDDVNTLFYMGIKKLTSGGLSTAFKLHGNSDEIQWNSNNEIAADSVVGGTTVGALTGNQLVERGYNTAGNLNTDYLQSGTSAIAPLIVSGGTLVTKNGKVALDFSGGFKYMEKSLISGMNESEDYTFSVVLAPTIADGSDWGPIMCSRQNSVSGTSRIEMRSDMRDAANLVILQNDSNTVFVASQPTAPSNPNLFNTLDTRVITYVKAGKKIDAYLNGVFQSTFTYTGTFPNETFVIGRRQDSRELNALVHMVKVVGEAITADTVLKWAQRDAIDCNFTLN